MKLKTTEKQVPSFLLSIEGDDIHVVTPEGARKSMSLKDFVEALTKSQTPDHGIVLPDGVKMVFSRGRVTTWVYQAPPCLRRLKWIADDSPAPFGEDAKYREVTIALPYVIVLAVFISSPGGRMVLSDHNEAFFRNAPLASVDDELCYPALLNCSKFDPQRSRPLSWICTQYLHRRFDAEPDDNKRFRLSLGALLACLFETGFNYSSEHHELTSWFTESKSVDERIATIGAWEEASAADKLFPLEVPWLPTGLSLRDVVERIFRMNRGGQSLPHSARGLAGFILNHAEDLPPAGEPLPHLNPELPF